MEIDSYGVSEFFDNSGNLPASQESIKKLVDQAFSTANSAHDVDEHNHSLLISRDGSNSAGEPAPLMASIYLHTEETDGLILEIEVSSDFSSDSPMFKKTSYQVFIDADNQFAISKNVRYPDSDVAARGLQGLMSTDIDVRRQAEEDQDELLRAEEQSKMLQEQLGMDVVSQDDIEELIFIFKSPNRLPPRPDNN